MFFFQADDGIRVFHVTGVQTCALPIWVLRPTLLLVAIISVSLLFQRDRLKDISKSQTYKSILILIGYIVVSLPLVEWPGSVVKNNIPDFVKAIVFFFFTAFIIDSEKKLNIFLLVFLGFQVIILLCIFF